ncbi:CubicO group peptidase, beta-lactamase class C family [Halopseudomonas sabulinigri]|uniref:CubicO group peptidase, beta-lactamase class C family n=1 Tax=Halopseudomonas sabulinigri TaxID=472181 RepID=A0A1H1PU47_9GAMM|nr:serine hydrolase [Halopseudomonas sabulinigri]SDS14654.1 CubicO group peptidase, beta-lactamase class C family [Halopseudomonas sabulinigri]
MLIKPDRPRSRCINSLLAALLLQSAGALADCVTPPANADWPTAPAGQHGFTAAQLQVALNTFNEPDTNLHALLIERDGELLLECYRSGKDTPITRRYGLPLPFTGSSEFDADELHDQRSISKSVVSLLYGIALAEQQAPPLDRPVLKDYPSITPVWQHSEPPLTYRHLLGMTAGLDWQELGHGLFSSDETPLYWRRDLAAYVLERDRVASPGTRFTYNGGATALLAATLEQRSQQTLTALAADRLFAPLGITRFEWAEDARNRSLAFSGLRLRPRDLLKIGRLVNQRGQWHGQQLVSADWIDKITAAQITTDIDLFSLDGKSVQYGYQWWSGTVQVAGREHRWVAAIGNGGQRLLLIPALQLGLVLQGGDYGSAEIQRRENQLVLQLLAAMTRQD